jgi:hypothetical protein
MGRSTPGVVGLAQSALQRPPAGELDFRVFFG